MKKHEHTDKSTMNQSIAKPKYLSRPKNELFGGGNENNENIQIAQICVEEIYWISNVNGHNSGGGKLKIAYEIGEMADAAIVVAVAAAVNLIRKDVTSSCLSSISL